MKIIKALLTSAVILVAANSNADQSGSFLFPLEEQLYTTLRDTTANKCSSKIYDSKQQLVGMAFDGEFLIAMPVKTIEVPFKAISYGESIPNKQQHVYFSETETGKAYLSVKTGKKLKRNLFSATIAMSVITKNDNVKHSIGKPQEVLIHETCSKQKKGSLLYQKSLFNWLHTLG